VETEVGDRMQQKWDDRSHEGWGQSSAKCGIYAGLTGNVKKRRIGRAPTTSSYRWLGGH
jgi:hypothetical protein